MDTDLRRLLGVTASLGDNSEVVDEARRLLGMKDGVFDEALRLRWRGFLRAHGLKPVDWINDSMMDALRASRTNINKSPDQGEAASVVVASAVGLVSFVSATAPAAVLAVSDGAVNNAQFTAAVVASILGFAAILGWFGKTAFKAVRLLQEIASTQAQHSEDIKRIEARQVEFQARVEELSADGDRSN